MAPCEEVPLNSTRIVLGARAGAGPGPGPGSTVIHLQQSEKAAPQDVGLHINTTFAIASSKKIKLLFILSFLMSIICMILSSSVAFYYWNEMTSMRRQLEVIKDQLMLQSNQALNQNFYDSKQSALTGSPKLSNPAYDSSESVNRKQKANSDARTYFVQDLGSDLHFTDSKNKDLAKADEERNVSLYQKEDLLVAHFVGAGVERILRTESEIGPLVHDEAASSNGSAHKVQLKDSNSVLIREDGLYLVYAQVVYLTHAPNCFYIWAKYNSEKARLLTSCATGDDSSLRPLSRSQISCSTTTVARLRKNDLINMAQRERNTTLWLKPGYTHLGLVKLSS